MKDGTLVRVTAATTLDRVVRTGAYSNIVVHMNDLSARDRSAHQNLVFTALRWMIPIDAAISGASSRALAHLDPKVLSVLRIAATELLILDHSPHGVVDGAVDAAVELGIGRAKGFVNAVARRLAASRPGPYEAHESFPPWMRAGLESAFGDVDSLFDSLNGAVTPGLRARTGQTLDATPVDGIPGAFYAHATSDVDDLVASGDVDIIDPASSAVALALGARPDDLVADLAAAPGGKTRALADAVTGAGWIAASDRHRTRLVAASQRSSDIDRIEWVRMDAATPAYRPGTFDRVLLDAPCTGLGTVRRRPEIRHRIPPDAPERYGKMQRSLLMAALPLLKPGGRLVYSVCTMFHQETTDVVAELGGRAPDMAVGDLMGDGRMLTPLNAGTDAMFISIFGS